MKYLDVPQDAVMKLYGLNYSRYGPGILFEVQDSYMPQYLDWHRAKNGPTITIGTFITHSSSPFQLA